jgi:hypothetical protein
MTDTVAKRPPTLVGACLYLGSLSAIIAIRALVFVSTWNADNRASEVAGTLRQLRDAGLSRADAETTYKVIVTIVAVLAACGVVFAVYTARGQQASRVGMTIVVGLSGFASFAGFIGGDFLFVMIGALAIVFLVRLWTGEIRTYFRTLAGHAPPPPAAPKPAVVSAAAQAPQHPASQAPTQAPGPPPGPQVQGYGPPPPGYYQPVPQRPGVLPKPVSIAVWTACISSAVVVAFSALGLLSLGLIGSDYEELMRDSPLGDDLIKSAGMTYDQLYRTSLTVLGLCLALSLAGLAAAVLVLVKKRSGDVFLFVMTVVTIIASILLFPAGLPWTAAAIVSLVHLRKPESKAWFSQT